MLEVSSERFARSVDIQVRGMIPDDNHFHLAPGAQRRIRLRADGSGHNPSGRVSAVNATRSCRVTQAKSHLVFQGP